MKRDQVNIHARCSTFPIISCEQFFFFFFFAPCEGDHSIFFNVNFETVQDITP